MLQKTSDINGYKIIATDGSLGTVSDVLFDDASWLVRWLVVDTGNGLSGRKVLLPPSALGHIDPDAHSFSVRLTRAQVKDSPDFASDWPVSRQQEGNVYDYYGWSPYWSTGPRSARDINWSDRLINLDVDRAVVCGSPLYDATVTVDRGYEQAYHRYYDASQPPAER